MLNFVSNGWLERKCRDCGRKCFFLCLFVIVLFLIGVNDITLAAGEDFDGTTVQGSYAKLTNITPVAPFDEKLQITISTPTRDSIVEGDEILVNINSRDQSGNYCGQSYYFDESTNALDEQTEKQIIHRKAAHAYT